LGDLTATGARPLRRQAGGDPGPPAPSAPAT